MKRAPLRNLLGVLTATMSLLLVGGCGSDSRSAPAADTVAERTEPLVKRVSYPTRTAADPNQNWADLYLPAGQHTAASMPLVVLIHGGSWQSGVGAEGFGPYARALVDRGLAVYNIEYRRVGSGGGWPTTFDDVSHALDHVVELNGEHPEFRTHDELVVGHSAGAQLAMWAGTRHALHEDLVGNDPRFRPTRVVSLAGPLDMRYAAAHGDDRIVRVLGGTPDEVPDRYAAVDPIQNIDPKIPVMAVHGTADTVVSPENSKRYVAEVKKQGGTGKLFLFDGEDHNSLIVPSSRAYPKILDLIADTSVSPIDQLRIKHSD